MREPKNKSISAKQSNWDQAEYLRTKKALSKVMRKLTIQELQEIILHPRQSYIFFDCAIDVLMFKMGPLDFRDFCQGLYRDE